MAIGAIGADWGAGAIVEEVGWETGSAETGSGASFALWVTHQALGTIDDRHARTTGIHTGAIQQELARLTSLTLQLRIASHTRTHTSQTLIHPLIISIRTCPKTRRAQLIIPPHTGPTRIH